MLASDVLGRLALDTAGRPLGRVVDMFATVRSDGSVVIERVAISRRRLRLLSFDREELRAPAVVAFFARRIQGRVEVRSISDLSFAEVSSG
jgi:hypothetical protein